MTIEIKVPAMGESVTEATVARWFKKEGDSVARDEPLLELETDKVTVEVPAPASGAIESISVRAGDTVQVGAILGAIAEGKAGAPSVVAASNPDSAAPKAAPAPKPAAAPAAAKPVAAAPVMPSAQRIAAENNINPASPVSHRRS
jgi:2-oxoglutarate dehydrogenase E2 component (dihydrolipoamide succinyltransferase)